MKLGTYSPEITRATLDEVMRDTRAYGFTCTQFSFMSMPATDGETDVLKRLMRGDEVPAPVVPETVAAVREAASRHGIEIAAVNGTYNMAHHSRSERREGLRHLEEMMRVAKELKSPLVTLCAGSRLDMGWQFGWMWHDDNTTPEAWADLRESLTEACVLAERYDLRLGVEIEASTILDSAEKTRKMFDEVGSKRLGLIYDGGNLFKSGDIAHEQVIEVMKRTFDLFENDIVLIHGKDLAHKAGVHFAACGQGIVDYDYFLSRVKQIGYDGPMIIHGVHDEAYFPQCVAFMQQTAERNGL